MPPVPVPQLSPKTFLSQTHHKSVGDCTTMGADCGILNLTFQRILCSIVSITPELVAIHCADRFKQLAMLNIARHFLIHSDEMAEVREIRFGTLFKFVDNLCRQFFTQMQSKFADCKLVKGQQIFFYSRRNWLLHGVRNHAQDLGDLINLTLNLVAVDENLNGGHRCDVVSGGWCAVGGIMNDQNPPPLPLVCHL